MKRHQHTSLLRRAAAVGAFSLALAAIPSVAGAVEVLTAVVNFNGAFVRGIPAGTTSGRVGLVGDYKVIFKRKVNNCTFGATIGSPGAQMPMGGGAKVSALPGNQKGVRVDIGQGGEPADRPFHLIVVCPDAP